MKTIIPVQNGDTLAALRGFLKKLLETGQVEALLVPMRTPYGPVAHALVCDPALLDAADPLAPVLPVNSATLAGKLSAREPRARIGVVMRSCELRALVELVKMQQACMENLTLIALDCAGVYPITYYNRKAGKGAGAEALWQPRYAAPASPDPDLRAACRVCEQPTYSGAQISIELIGSDLSQAIQLDLPEEMAASLGYEAGEENGRQAALEALLAARIAQRDADFSALRARLEGEEGLVGVFGACIRCHNCMTVCPICYCKTCVFKSPIFDHDPMQFVNWAKQKGALRMPSDTALFHMTRLNHMALSCVGCGMCTEACPAELPVGLAFRAIGERLQATFEYAPGRSLTEPLPLVNFKADEWTDVGE